MLLQEGGAAVSLEQRCVYIASVTQGISMERLESLQQCLKVCLARVVSQTAIHLTSWSCLGTSPWGDECIG